MPYVLRPTPRPTDPRCDRERQDSVFNGFSQTKEGASVVCIHDSARPLVSQEAVMAVRAGTTTKERFVLRRVRSTQRLLHTYTQSLRDGVQHGAAVLGVPMKATVKVRGVFLGAGHGVIPILNRNNTTHRLTIQCKQESEDGEFVLRTIPRARLWEIQTPQVRFCLSIP